MASQAEAAGQNAVTIGASATTQVTRIAMLVAAGLLLFIFESAIPRPLPWLKPGLANLATLIALYLFGFRMALLVMLVRVILGALIMGTLFNPVFVFGIAGGMVATCVMGMAQAYLGRVLSIIGISLLGSFSHNFTQLLIAAYLVIGSERALVLLPLMLISALFSGFLVGTFAHYILLRMRNVVS